MLVRGFFLGVALFGLAACDASNARLAESLSRIGVPSDATGEGIRTLALLGGDVRVRGPEGYCIDQSASNSRDGFAVLAGCALLSETAAVMPALDGLVTVQFGAPDTASVAGNEDAFADFLKTNAGRGLLAGSGDVANIGEIATISDRAGVLVRFEDTSGPAFTGTSGAQWRGFLDINGRLATISVLSFDRAALSRGEGERLLVVAMAELAEVNATVSVADAIPEQSN